MAEFSSEEIFKSCESRSDLSPKLNLRRAKNMVALNNISESTDDNENSVIQLPDMEEFTIGRWPKADVFLTKSDNMISRRHATFKLVDDTWLVRDDGSVNGIFLNSRKLIPNTEHVINDKDVIQFGVSPGPTLPSKFIYKFTTGNNCVDEGVSPPKHKKRRVEICEEGPSHSCNSENSDVVLLAETLRLELVQKEKEAAEKVSAQEDELNKLKEQLLQKELMEVTVHEEMKRKEEEMWSQLRTTKLQSEEEMKHLEDRMKAQYEKELKEKEDSLMARLSSEKEALLTAKQKVEDDLQKEMEAKLEAKDHELQEELEKEKSRLDKVIEKKELEQRMLESELSLSKEENIKQQTEALREKETTLSNLTELLETELQCAICNELFIEAMSLSCSHSYCKMCIEEWIKKKPECPICRAKITSRARSIVLDNYIDRMVEHLSDDLKIQRKQLMESRKPKVVPSKPPVKKPPVNPPQNNTLNVLRMPYYGQSLVTRGPAPPIPTNQVRPNPPYARVPNPAPPRPPNRGRNNRNRGRGAARTVITHPNTAPTSTVSASPTGASTRTSLLGTSTDTAILLTGSRHSTISTDGGSLNAPIIIPSEDVPEFVRSEVVVTENALPEPDRAMSSVPQPITNNQGNGVVLSSGNKDGDGSDDEESEEDDDEDEDEEEREWEYRRRYDGRRRYRYGYHTDSDEDADSDEDGSF